MIRVSDHALLRWLERVEGVGVQAMRMRFGPDLLDRQLVAIVEREMKTPLAPTRAGIADLLIAAAAPDDGLFEFEGKLFVLEDRHLKTVMLAGRFSNERLRADRRKAREKHRALLTFRAGEPVVLRPGEDWGHQWR